MTARLDALPTARQADILAAVCALESAHGPVATTAYRALAEPDLREAVRDLLSAAGRVLVPVGKGYTSGYDDQISARLRVHPEHPVPRRDQRHHPRAVIGLDPTSTCESSAASPRKPPARACSRAIPAAPSGSRRLASTFPASSITSTS